MDPSQVCWGQGPDNMQGDFEHGAVHLVLLIILAALLLPYLVVVMRLGRVGWTPSLMASARALHDMRGVGWSCRCSRSGGGMTHRIPVTGPCIQECCTACTLHPGRGCCGRRQNSTVRGCCPRTCGAACCHARTQLSAEENRERIPACFCGRALLGCLPLHLDAKHVSINSPIHPFLHVKTTQSLIWTLVKVLLPLALVLLLPQTTAGAAIFLALLLLVLPVSFITWLPYLGTRRGQVIDVSGGTRGAKTYIPELSGTRAMWKRVQKRQASREEAQGAGAEEGKESDAQQLLAKKGGAAATPAPSGAVTMDTLAPAGVPPTAQRRLSSTASKLMLPVEMAILHSEASKVEEEKKAGEAAAAAAEAATPASPPVYKHRHRHRGEGKDDNASGAQTPRSRKSEKKRRRSSVGLGAAWMDRAALESSAPPPESAVVPEEAMFRTLTKKWLPKPHKCWKVLGEGGSNWVAAVLSTMPFITAIFSILAAELPPSDDAVIGYVAVGCGLLFSIIAIILAIISVSRVSAARPSLS